MGLVLKSKPVVDDNVELLQQRCAKLKKVGLTPLLKVILVGNHPPSLIYTRNKKKFCEKINAACDIVHLDEKVSEKEFLKVIQQFSSDRSVHGLFVQLPLPNHLQHINVGEFIPANKDVDGFHNKNLIGLMKGDRGENFLIPCTPKGIMALFDYYGIEIAKKNVVVIGRSLIVGKPMAMLLTNYNATVTLCHSQTQNIEEITRRSDIIISAVGSPRYLGAKHIEKDQKSIIIDVGICRDDEGKLCGDVDFNSIIDLVQALSPVPGGVGPLTILFLASNLVTAAENQL